MKEYSLPSILFFLLYENLYMGSIPDVVFPETILSVPVGPTVRNALLASPYSVIASTNGSKISLLYLHSFTKFILLVSVDSASQGPFSFAISRLSFRDVGSSSL